MPYICFNYTEHALITVIGIFIVCLSSYLVIYVILVFIYLYIYLFIYLFTYLFIL